MSGASIFINRNNTLRIESVDTDTTEFENEQPEDMLDPGEELEEDARETDADDLEEGEESGSPGMRRVVIAGAIILLVAMAAIVVGTLWRPAPRIITVNGESLRVEDYQQTMKFEYYLQTGGASLDSFGIDLITAGEYLQESIINDMVIKAKAEELDLSVTDEAVDEEARVIFGYDEADPTTAETADTAIEEFLTGAVDTTGLDADTVDALFRQKVSIVLLIDEIARALELSVEESRLSLSASHILVATEEEALAVLDRLANGEDFAALATELSLDTASGVNGGDLGTFGEGMMIEPFENAVLALEVDEVSQPVQTDFGWHIIWLTGREEIPLTAREIQSQNQQQVLALVEEWKGEYEISVSDEWVDYMPDLP
jgi:parvulin-like peptidyl-prolyl isomerase